jgi:hypothetical protein
MSDKAPALAGQINHVKVIVLALVAAAAMILIGFNARAIDDTKGYGLVQISSQATLVSHGIDRGAR